MKKLAIFGTSGFSKEVLDIAIDQGYEEIVFLTHEENKEKELLGFLILHERDISLLVESGFVFAIAMGSGELREKIYQKYPNLIYPNLIHSSVTMGVNMRESLTKSQGLIIAAGVRITNSCEFGDFIVLNLNVTIGHDSKLENFVSIMPGANISGNVYLSKCSYIGTGAIILQGKDEQTKMIIGVASVVGAGAVVVKAVADNIIVVGSPAKELKRVS